MNPGKARARPRGATKTEAQGGFRDRAQRAETENRSRRASCPRRGASADDIRGRAPSRRREPAPRTRGRAGAGASARERDRDRRLLQRTDLTFIGERRPGAGGAGVLEGQALRRRQGGLGRGGPAARREDGMITIRPRHERGKTKFDWLDSSHTFS